MSGSHVLRLNDALDSGQLALEAQPASAGPHSCPVIGAVPVISMSSPSRDRLMSHGCEVNRSGGTLHSRSHGAGWPRRTANGPATLGDRACWSTGSARRLRIPCPDRAGVEAARRAGPLLADRIPPGRYRRCGPGRAPRAAGPVALAHAVADTPAARTGRFTHVSWRSLSSARWARGGEGLVVVLDKSG